MLEECGLCKAIGPKSEEGVVIPTAEYSHSKAITLWPEHWGRDPVASSKGA